MKEIILSQRKAGPLPKIGKGAAVIIDGTEFPIRAPSTKELCTIVGSGRKKSNQQSRHNLKYQLGVQIATGRIVWLVEFPRKLKFGIEDLTLSISDLRYPKQLSQSDALIIPNASFLYPPPEVLELQDSYLILLRTHLACYVDLQVDATKRELTFCIEELPFLPCELDPKLLGHEDLRTSSTYRLYVILQKDADFFQIEEKHRPRWEK